MKFKKNSPEANKYLNDLMGYVEALSKYLNESNAFISNQKPQTDDKLAQSQIYVECVDYNERVDNHKKYMEGILNSILNGNDIPDNYIDELNRQRKDIAGNIPSYNEVLGAEETNNDTVIAFEMKLYFDTLIPSVDKAFNAISVIPEAATEKKVDSPYKAQYIEEFERLTKQMKKTNPWYSKGSEAYQMLENDLRDGLEMLKNCEPGKFDETFRKVINTVNARSEAYKDSHQGKLDKRQMNRMKLMNRFYLLGENFNDASINPTDNYINAIAEKYVHAGAINALTKNNNNIEARRLLTETAFLKKNIESMVNNSKFLNILPEGKNELDKMLKTNGLTLMKDTLKSVRSEKEKKEQINKTLGTEVIKDDVLSPESIAYYEKLFANMDSKTSTNTISNAYGQGRNMGRSSTLSPAEKRFQRLNADPENMFDIVLTDPELMQLEKKMLEGNEFTYSSNIPDGIRYCNNLGQLLQFKDEHPNLSEAEKKYIDNHIATEKFYSLLEENKQEAKLTEPTIGDDGSIILDNIHLDTLQSSDMGCYSCSAMLLLQSRGLNLDQRVIRNYRMEGSVQHFDNEERERTSGDHMGNVVNIGGIATKCIKNTAMREKTYTEINSASVETKFKLAEDIRNSVLEALTIHHSPVSFLKGGHYLTIVGYNNTTGKFIYKNSLPDNDFRIKHPGESYSNVDPDENHEMGMEDLINTNKLAIAYLVSIDPEDPLKHFDDKTLEFVNGQYQQNNLALTGIHVDGDNPDGKLIVGSKMLGGGGDDICSVQTITKVPKKLELTPELERKYSIKPKESPEKQDLLKQIKDAEDDLFPDKNIRMSVDGRYDQANYQWTDLRFKSGEVEIPKEHVLAYLYLQKLKAKIDILTPWQVEHAFDPDRINSGMDGISKNEANVFLLLSCGHDKQLNELGEEVYTECRNDPQIVTFENQKLAKQNNIINNNPPEKEQPVKEAPVLHS